MGSKAYAAAFESKFMHVLDKLVGDQKVGGEIHIQGQTMATRLR